jgi:hypothetical protein
MLRLLLKGLWEFVSDWHSIGRLRNTWPFQTWRTYRVLDTFQNYTATFTEGEILQCMVIRDVPYDGMTEVHFVDQMGRERELLLKFEMSNRELVQFMRRNFERLPR